MSWQVSSEAEKIHHILQEFSQGADVQPFQSHILILCKLVIQSSLSLDELQLKWVIWLKMVKNDNKLWY